MDENHRLAGFKALLESRKTNSHHLEEPDGSLRQWRDLSAEGRLAYIVRDAATHDVPFEQFAEAARESVGHAAIEEAALRLALCSERELHRLERLFPDDGRTEPTPLVERITELLDALSPKHDSEVLLTAEEQTALFTELRTDYANGKREDAHAKETLQKLFDEKAHAPAAEKGKDNGIER